jgi:hypothetical protein
MYKSLRITILLAVLWVRQLIVSFSPWRHGFSPRPVLVACVVDKVAL